MKAVPSRIGLVVILLSLGMLNALKAQETQRQYLSGTDKDHTVNWEFFINTGMKSGAWSKIPVPSNWEMQGFGTYNYFRDTQNPDETGQYKHQFKVPASQAGKTIFIVFEASMTETEVKINGKSAGPVHQGGFYRFKYDITDLVNTGADNLLEVTVKKRSSNESVNQAERKADFWLFGGIFRPVYLELLPRTYIDRIALDAKADGALRIDVYPVNLPAGISIKAQVQTLKGQPVGLPFSVKTSAGQIIAGLQRQVKGVQPWNPETPDLYNLLVWLTDAQGRVVHRIKQRFGFRTAELRPHDGFYVNNRKVVFKGVCRHSEWPESGRALSKTLNLADVKLMKDMNMNAVRMSHYPPDQDFLDICDSLGLFVLDELTGWQAKYDVEAGRKLVKELVVRDVNHPAIVIWDNGNEGGWNTALDGDYQLYDPQKRLVIHPWEKFNGTDTKHYPDYNYVMNSVLYGKEVFFPTEFMHGLHDGGHGAGLDDFWSLMRRHPHFAGGFLWSFADEGVSRLDQNGKIDVQGNLAPDGIVGPHREKEGSFFTIKEIWSPVQVDLKLLPVNFDGKIPVTNDYLYTNLDKCVFEWKLVSLPSAGSGATTETTDASKKMTGPSLAPGSAGMLSLGLPANWKNSDVLYLTAFDQYRQELFTWSWPIHMPGMIKPVVKAGAKVGASETDSCVVIAADGMSYYFSKRTGNLQQVVTPKATVALSGGPVVAGVKHTLNKLNHFASGDTYVVEISYTGPSLFNVKWTFSPGQAAKLDYQYAIRGEADFAGITFNYPEELVTGVRWEGRGPYRVWKNRMKGQQFGVWQKNYNNVITGESWEYPEFKGYHADLFWATIQNKQSPFTVYATEPGTFLQLYKPLKAAGAANENTNPLFPEGNIGFMDAISPIGTKFQAAEKMGPQSVKNVQLNAPVKGSLWFDFR
ncbi:glycoside hydrolase family 2 protein [Hufsiella ginkgonis]|uniref:beta-galactosidase n=1 Tax=Hufsiella ginkgonis TaxID=2695274 RepID=A0A7K1XT23_9SPHI|nr:glycoside hydrolase family 2 TIM barrel-domain containing protein [Hufsiella ginkgonis]MXV14102.1 glycoside hydrolase family 2 [Hufsiella ginkgonis]